MFSSTFCSSFRYLFVHLGQITCVIAIFLNPICVVVFVKLVRTNKTRTRDAYTYLLTKSVLDTCIAIGILSYGIHENYIVASNYYHTYSLQLFELIYFYYIGMACQLMSTICQIAASFNIYRMLSGKFKIFDKLSCKIVILMAFIFSFGYFTHVPLTTQISHETSMIFYSIDEFDMSFLDSLNASISDGSYHLKFDQSYELIDNFIWITFTLIPIVHIILLKIAMRKTNANNISVSNDPPRNPNELLVACGFSDENSMAQALFAMNILASIGFVLRCYHILKHYTNSISDFDTCLIEPVRFIFVIKYGINFIFYTMYMVNFLRTLLLLVRCYRKNGADYTSLPQANSLNMLPQSSQL